MSMHWMLVFVLGWLVIGGGIFGRRFVRVATRVLRRASRWVERECESETKCWEAIRARVIAAIERGLKAVRALVRGVAASATGGKPTKPSRLPDVLVVIVTLLGSIAALTNQILLADIIPDLLGVAPKDRLVGVGWAITVVAPTAILLGEAVGGLTHIRRSIGLGLFMPSFALEVFSAVRRAVEIVHLGADAAEQGYRFVAYSHAGAYLVLSVALPWLVYSSGRYLEPLLVGATPGATLRRSAGCLGTMARNAVVRGALLVLVLAYAATWCATTLAISAWRTLGRVVELVVEPALLIVLSVGCWLPWFILRRLAQAGRAITAWRAAEFGVAAGLLLLLLAASAFGDDRGASSRPFATVVQTRESSPEIPTDELLAMRASELRPRLRARVAVNRITNVRLAVCIVDATESIPRTFRQATLRACADFIGGLAPEFVGAVVLVSDAGLTSSLRIVWRDHSAAARRCAATRSLPDLPPQSTLFDLALADVRRWLDREVGRCTDDAERSYQEAVQRIGASKDDFVRTVVHTLEGSVFARTDLMGTLARMPEIIAQAERRAGFPMLDVDIHLISDLVDDVRCTRAERSSCDQHVLTRVRELVARDATRVLVHQVVLDAPAQQANASAWRSLWATVAPEAVVDTWGAGARLSEYRLALHDSPQPVPEVPRSEK